MTSGAYLVARNSPPRGSEAVQSYDDLHVAVEDAARMSGADSAAAYCVLSASGAVVVMAINGQTMWVDPSTR